LELALLKRFCAKKVKARAQSLLSAVPRKDTLNGDLCSALASLQHVSYSSEHGLG
jgi:hypothetical protein